jgi:hypothetical protein
MRAMFGLIESVFRDTLMILAARPVSQRTRKSPQPRCAGLQGDGGLCSSDFGRQSAFINLDAVALAIQAWSGAKSKLDSKAALAVSP